MKRYFGLLLPVLVTLVGLAVLFNMPSSGNQPAQAAFAPDAGIVVNTLEDELNSDGDCSLREAVTAANTNAAVDACPAGDVLTDTITFGVAGTITVASLLSVTAGGPLVIDGGEIITTSGGGTTRVWWVETGSMLTLKNLSVTNGLSGGSYPGGAGLYNDGNVTIINSTFSANRCGMCKGGGISNGGTLNIINSTLYNNSSWAYWGAPADGGGIQNWGILTITNSTFCNNSTHEDESFQSCGGGVNNEVPGVLTIINSTFFGNSGDQGGGVCGFAVLTNTIVANNAGGDCSGTITDGGHNLDSDGSCGLDPANGSLPNTDPILGPLQDNGGPTWTHALLEGSPAIDAGDNAQCPPNDQRGFYRPIDGDGNGIRVCDIGSYEYGSVAPWGIHLLPVHQHRDGVPGAAVTYHIDLFNTTEITDTYNLALGSYTWETTLSTDTIGPIQPFSSQTFTLTVVIPPEADWYMEDTVVITATSVTSPTEYFASAKINTQAYAPPQINVSPPVLTSTLDSGQIITLPLTINNGNGVTLTYEINEILYDDAVLVLKLDEPADSTIFYDISGWNNHGTCSGDSCPASGVVGHTGQAVLFDGIDDYIQAPTNGFSTGNDARTIAAWVKINSVMAYEGLIAGYGNFGSGNQAYAIFIYQGDNQLLCFSQWGAGVCGPRLELNEWYHVGVTNVGNWVTLYLNGLPVAFCEVEIDTPPGTQFYLGRIPGEWGDTRRLNGFVDEVAVFDRALTPDEIMALYQDGFGGDAPWLSVEPVSGTVPANTSLPIQVTFDAMDLQPDTYTSTLYTTSNDPIIPVVEILIMMTVEPTPSMGWVEGVVTDLRTGEPVEATIIAEGQPYTVTSNAGTGYYKFWLGAGSYILQVSAEGYVSQSLSVNITAQQGATQDFDLQLDAPWLGYSPENFTSAQMIGQVTTQTLTISNTGTTPLGFAIGEGITDSVLILHLDEPAGSTYFLDTSGYGNNASCTGDSWLSGSCRYTSHIWWRKWRIIAKSPPYLAGITAIPNEPDSCPLAGVEGMIGYSVDFDGVNDYLSIPHSQNFDEIENNDRVTIAAWVKIEDWYQGWFPILDQYEANNDWGWMFEINQESGIYFWTASSQAAICNYVPNLNEWHHIAVTYNRGVGTITFYADGVIVCQSAYNQDITDTQDEPLYIGLSASGGDEYSNGFVDEVAVFDRALTPDEIIALYLCGFGGDAPWLSVEPVSGTVPTNGSQNVIVTFDATDLQPDVYTTTLYVISNDPLNPLVKVPVTMTVTAHVTPTAVTISGPEAGWAGESQAFTALVEPISTILPLTYTWQATGQEPVTHTGGITDTVAFTWQTPGVQFITVTATNVAGSVLDTHAILINEVLVAPITVTISGPEAGWAGESQAFTALVEPISTTLPLTYTWQATGQEPVIHTGGITDTVAFTWQTPGVQLITVTATNVAGSVLDTHAILISDVPIEGLSASNDSPTVLGNPTTFTATVAAGTNITFAWDFGDETNRAGAVLTHTYLTAGVYTATVAASNSAGVIIATTQVTIVAPSYPVYLPIILKEQQVGSPPPVTKSGTVGFIAALLSGGTGVGWWLRKKIETSPKFRFWEFGGGRRGQFRRINPA